MTDTRKTSLRDQLSESIGCDPDEFKGMPLGDALNELPGYVNIMWACWTDAELDEEL